MLTLRVTRVRTRFWFETTHATSAGVPRHTLDKRERDVNENKLYIWNNDFSSFITSVLRFLSCLITEHDYCFQATYTYAYRIGDF